MDAFNAWAIGLHIATAHLGGAGLESNTPGAWARYEPWGLQAGFYQNSVPFRPKVQPGDILPPEQRRTSFYVGKAWQSERWGLLAGAASGYGVDCKMVRGPWMGGTSSWQECERTRELRPLLVPSYRFERVLGVRPVLGLVIARRPGIHLALEL